MMLEVRSTLCLFVDKLVMGVVRRMLLREGPLSLPILCFELLLLGVLVRVEGESRRVGRLIAAAEAK